VSDEPSPEVVEDAPQEERSKLRVAGAWAREIGIVVIGALIASTLIRAFLLQMFEIPSGSMNNTLVKDDRVAVLKVGGYGRGDVVVFKDTQNWLSDPVQDPGFFGKALIFIGLLPDTTSNFLIKRVIGVEGDHVVCCDASGKITVNGYALNEVDYLYPDPSSPTGVVDPSANAFDVVVPKGHIWVMGDHRNDSADSRYHMRDPVPEGEVAGANAFVPVEDVVGKAVLVIFPFDHFKALPHQVAFDGVPDPATVPDEPIITVTID
jgi:signal peptidase I